MTRIVYRSIFPVRFAVGAGIILFSMIGSSATAQTDNPANNPTELSEAIATAANGAADIIETADIEPELRLFEAIDSAATADSPRNRRTRNVQATRNTPSNPEFTLVGTSRIGDKYTVILTHKDGDTVVVSAGPDTSTQINGHSQFSIVDVGAREVSINYPDGTPCIEFKAKGVNCNMASNTANLTLTYGAPLAPRQRQGLVVDQETRDVAAEDAATSGDEPVNPFAALREAAAGNTDGQVNGNRNTARFNPRRIAPEDVPPGQRVVSTPFGDRLVDQ